MTSQDLQTLLEGTGDAAFVAGPDGLIRFWNRAAFEMFGVPAARATGRPCWDVIGGRDVSGAAICSPDCRLLASDFHAAPVPSFDALVDTGRPGGVWLNMSTIRARAGRSDPVTIHLIRDIDARKRMENVTRGFLAQVAGLSGQSIEDLLQPAPVPHEPLTPREQEIARHLALGHGTATIARQLGISSATVRNHVRAILGKLSVHSRTSAVLLAIREKLI